MLSNNKARTVETEVRRQVNETVETSQQRAGRLDVWNKARKIETETSLQRAERLEVLSKTKQERLRQRQVNNERRATRDVEQNKASQYCWWKAETSHERADRQDDRCQL